MPRDRLPHRLEVRVLHEGHVLRVELLRQRREPDEVGEEDETTRRSTARSVVIAGLSLVADRFDVVAVGVEDERAVVGRVVVLADAGRAVVGAAGRERGRVEGVDRLAVVAGERDVRAGAVRLALRDPELVLALGAERGGLPLLEGHRLLEPERLEGLPVEGPAALEVAHVDADMVEHLFLSSRSSLRP